MTPTPDGLPSWSSALVVVARRSRLRSARPRMRRAWILGSIWFALAALALFAVQGGWRPLGIASSTATLTATLFALGAAAVLTFALALGWVVRRPRPGDADTGASIVDDVLDLDDLLKAGLDAHRRDHETATERAGAFRQLLIERAERTAATLDPESLVPMSPGRASWAAGAVLIAAGLVPFLLPSDASLRSPSLAAGAENGTAVPDPTGEDSEFSGEDEEPVVAEALPLPKLPEELQMARLDDASQLGDAQLEELETMSPEELASLLEQMRNAQGLDAAVDGEPVDPSEMADVEPGADAREQQASGPNDDGLEELPRSAEDPFAGPDQQAQAGGDPSETSAAPGESAQNEAVQRIELPPMANPNARQSEAGEARAAVAMAAADPSDAQAPPPDAPQSGAGGGESSGPQSGSENPFGEATELAVTLELALLEAEEEEERPIERSIRHRASEAQDAKVGRSGRRTVDQSADDRGATQPILSPAERARLGRYFEDTRWPQTPPPR